MAVADTLTERALPPRWYYYFLAGIGVIAVLGLVVGLLGLYLNDRTAKRQADCFEAFASQFSIVSKEVRAATVNTDRVEAEADEAAADRDAAFQRVLTFVIAQDDDEAEGLRLFTRLTDANAELVEKRDALVAARRELAQTRREHPIPDPPESGSTCELTE